MRSFSRLTAMVLAVAAAALTLTGCSAKSWEDDCATSPKGVIECPPGNRPAAPKVTGELLDGSDYDLTGVRGQVVVLNFWGSWCAPCRAEVDDLEETYQATKDQGVAFIGINLRDDRDKARAFHSGRTSYPSIFDPAGRTALDFEVAPKLIPATFILDREGRIAAVLRRATQADELTPLVQGIATERAPTGGA